MTQEEFDVLINISHPRESIRSNQKELLEKSPPELFEFNRLMLLYGNAAYRYSDLRFSLQMDEK